jgi:predicted thioredoxin/glutaredoxin
MRSKLKITNKFIFPKASREIDDPALVEELHRQILEATERHAVAYMRAALEPIRPKRDCWWWIGASLLYEQQLNKWMALSKATCTQLPLPAFPLHWSPDDTV